MKFSATLLFRVTYKDQQIVCFSYTMYYRVLLEFCISPNLNRQNRQISTHEFGTGFIYATLLKPLMLSLGIPIGF